MHKLFFLFEIATATGLEIIKFVDQKGNYFPLITIFLNFTFTDFFLWNSMKR